MRDARCATITIVLDDGDYEGVVIDVEARGDEGGSAISVAISAGDHRGDVVTVVGAIEDEAALMLLGSPCTLRVASGMPRLELEQGI